MAGTNGMIAIAKKHNMILLTPFSPNKACADGDGSCWYMGDPPGYAQWVEDLVKYIYTQYNIYKNRIAVGGYSSGAQFSMEWWIPSGAAQSTMDDGVIVAISYGGSPKMTEVSYNPAFKSNVHLNWNVGSSDEAYQNDGAYDAKSGYDYYTAAGFQTSLDLINGQGHDRDGQFGAVMDAQILEHVPVSVTAGTGGGGRTPTPGTIVDLGGFTSQTDDKGILKNETNFQKIAAIAILNNLSGLGAILVSSTVKEIRFSFRGVSTPTGTAFVRQWSSNGTVKVTFGSSDVSTVSTTAWTTLTFTNSNNTVTAAVGDRFGVEYTTGSSTDELWMRNHPAVNDESVQTSDMKVGSTVFTMGPANWAPTCFFRGIKGTGGGLMYYTQIKR
jgi:hypothetical protein